MFYTNKYILKFIFYNVDSCKIFVKYVLPNKIKIYIFSYTFVKMVDINVKFFGTSFIFFFWNYNMFE
jgi:hypothetical protein